VIKISSRIRLEPSSAHLKILFSEAILHRCFSSKDFLKQLLLSGFQPPKKVLRRIIGFLKLSKTEFQFWKITINCENVQITVKINERMIDREKSDEITCLMSVLIDLNHDYCELKPNILLLEFWWWIFEFDFIMIFLVPEWIVCEFHWFLLDWPVRVVNVKLLVFIPRRFRQQIVSARVVRNFLPQNEYII